MKIKLVVDGKARKIDTKKSTIIDLAKSHDIVLSNYIVRVNGKIVPEDEKLKDGDVIELFKVISGG
ncbi:MAG: MoaD/ThiS family protein [Candidatus Aenigmatarchaeota archaeon]|nr:MoaD/ThiS family protein [Candidatus Aenigmarchaeota archaeon]